MTGSGLSELSVRQLLARRRRLAAGVADPEGTLRGVLLREGRRCSSAGCRCRRGELHGPYMYLATYSDRRSRTIYVPAAAPAVGEEHVAADAAQRGVAGGDLADQFGAAEAAGVGVMVGGLHRRRGGRCCGKHGRVGAAGGWDRC